MFRAQILEEVITLQHDRGIATGLRGRNCHLSTICNGHCQTSDLRY